MKASEIFQSQALRHLKSENGQALVEYTIIVGLLALALVVAIGNVGDQVIDIWNDLSEDFDTIDDGVANSDVEFPQCQREENRDDR